MAEAQAELSAQKGLVTEDWAVVVLGFAIIIILIFGFLVPVPQFNWKSFDDLPATVLSVDNILKILLQFLFVCQIAIPKIMSSSLLALSQKTTKPFCTKLWLKYGTLLS